MIIKSKNPMLDSNFLEKLTKEKQRWVYARITALAEDEQPIEYIEGKATGGSINVDGSSAVRRTCQLTMIADEVNINNFYWGLNNKFKLEVGLKNKIDSQYPDIVWFNQGIYIITAFNTSQAVNNFNISISGKDKMCRLNGDIAGTLPHTTDFGIEEEYNSETGITTYTSIPVKRIIREAVQNFGKEQAKNIIINDIEDAGLDLLEYRGDVPLYLFKNALSDQISNMTINENQSCYINGIKTSVSGADIVYDNLLQIDIENEITPSKITLTEDGKNEYTIVKVEYGTMCGYRLTDLTFAGDLILNVGETITALLDKIKDMLGDFEYFYDVDGRFIFQKKQNYVSMPWNANERENSKLNRVLTSISQSFPDYDFIGSDLITQFQNNPNLLNLRNDFSVWGKKKTVSGSELDIHMRYAIDTKPTYYKTISGKEYYTKDSDYTSGACVDWREIIYQMALDYRRYYHDDDFLFNLAKNNQEHYPDGITGYEQYYVDLEGFWRTLYNPESVPKMQSINCAQANANLDQNYFINAFCPIEKTEDLSYDKTYVIYNDTFQPFINGACIINLNDTYYYKTYKGEMLSKLGADLPKYISVSDLYVEEGRKKFIDYTYENYSGQLYAKDQEYIVSYQDIINNNKLRAIYTDAVLSNGYIPQYQVDKFGSLDKEAIVKKYNIDYYEEYNEFNNDPNTLNYWNKLIYESPQDLLFWFDFLDSELSELGKYSAHAVGDRTKAINDTNVKSIFYREIPKVIFQSGEELYEHQTGYTYVQLQNYMENLFTISSKGVSAKEKIDSLLYEHSYCIEQTTLQVLPVYHIAPNSRIYVQDDNSKVNGEYIVSKLTIPLTYNGTMTINATKVVSNIN